MKRPTAMQLRNWSAVGVLFSMSFAPHIFGKADRAGDFTSVIQQIKRSICAIAVVENSQSGIKVSQIWGVGFFVKNDGSFVTAHHVVKPVEKSSQLSPTQAVVGIVPQGNWARQEESGQVKLLTFAVAKVDEEHDIALCKFTDNPFLLRETKGFVRPIRLDSQLPQDGLPVGFFGFVSDAIVPLFHQSVISTYMSVAAGKPGSYVQGPLLVLEAVSMKGVSGSPLFSADGRVFGIVLGVGQEAEGTQGIVAARPTKFIESFLRNTQTTPRDNSTSPIARNRSTVSTADGFETGSHLSE